MYPSGHCCWTEDSTSAVSDELLEGGDHLLQMGGECGVMNIGVGFFLLLLGMLCLTNYFVLTCRQV